jgi:hypothetical protein
MSMDKAFASLTSGLLARKGAAKPAMRPQLYTGTVPASAAIEDLGWNDMGDEPVAPRDLIDVRLPASLSGPAPMVPPVVRQQQEIEREFAAPAPMPVSEESPKPRRKAAAPKPGQTRERVRAEAALRAPAGSGRKAAFTLRLDAERHLRLRLACAVEHRSAQQLVVEAVDRLLAEMPEVERLAASLPPVGKA